MTEPPPPRGAHGSAPQLSGRAATAADDSTATSQRGRRGASPPASSRSRTPRRTSPPSTSERSSPMSRRTANSAAWPGVPRRSGHDSRRYHAAVPGRLQHRLRARGVLPGVGVPVGQHQHRGGEAVAAQVGDLPDLVPAPDAASSAASGRPSSAQQRSRRPLVQTRASGSPSWASPNPSWVPVPSRAKSSPSSSTGSSTVASRTQPAPGAVCAAYIRVPAPARGRPSAGRAGGSVRPVRPFRSSGHSSARPSAGSRWLAVNALAPQGPGCSTSSQVRAGRGRVRGLGHFAGNGRAPRRGRTHEGEPNPRPPPFLRQLTAPSDPSLSPTPPPPSRPSHTPPKAP